MKQPIVVVLVLALTLFASAQEPLPNDSENESGEREPLTVRDTAREPEEIIVRPYDWEPGMIPSAETMQQIYDLRGLGACLYVRGRYEEAFPYLQAAARTGFKLAQARLGYLYQHGLGTDRDTYAAIGWYGVAATGTTLPEIRNWFNKTWRGIPEKYRPAVSTLVEEYRERFGARRHRVGCDLSERAGTYMKTLTCRFRDEGIHVDHGRLVYSLSREWPLDQGQHGMDPVMDINSAEEDGIFDNAYPTSTPLRAGSSGC